MSFRDKVQCAFRLLPLPTVMISRKLRGSLAEKNVIRLSTLRNVKEVEAVLIAESTKSVHQISWGRTLPQLPAEELLFKSDIQPPVSHSLANREQWKHLGPAKWPIMKNAG
jgi:hypothetical protein